MCGLLNYKQTVKRVYFCCPTLTSLPQSNIVILGRAQTRRTPHALHMTQKDFVLHLALPDRCCQSKHRDGRRKRECGRQRAASVPTMPSRLNLQQLQQNLPFQNRTLQLQQALQINHRLNLGAYSIVSRNRRMPTGLWF